MEGWCWVAGHHGDAHALDNPEENSWLWSGLGAHLWVFAFCCENFVSLSLISGDQRWWPSDCLLEIIRWCVFIEHDTGEVWILQLEQEIGKEGLWESVTLNWVGSSNDFPSKSEYWLQTCLQCGYKLFVYWLICLSITLKSAITLICWIYPALCPLCQYASSTTQMNCVKLHTSERALIVANMKMILAALIAQIHIFVWSTVLLYLRKMVMYDPIAISLLSYIYWSPHLSSLTRTRVVLSFHF
jgi:hypothetical protein